MNILSIMLLSLSCTVVIECLVGFLIGIRSKYDFIFVILVNLLTNPLVVSLSLFLNFRYGYKVRMIGEIIFEILALVIEAFIYSKTLDYKKVKPFWISLILNISSYIIGYFINFIVW